MSAHQNTLKDRGRIKTNSYHQVAEPIYTPEDRPIFLAKGGRTIRELFA